MTDRIVTAEFASSLRLALDGGTPYDHQGSIT